jgi:hypothetical protein
MVTSPAPSAAWEGWAEGGGLAELERPKMAKPINKPASDGSTMTVSKRGSVSLGDNSIGLW